MSLKSVRSFVVNSVAALRASNIEDIAETEFVYLLGYDSPGDGGGGILNIDYTDLVTADNGYDTFVTTDGYRVKRVHDSEDLPIWWFGPWNAGIADWRARIESAAAAAVTTGKTLVLPKLNGGYPVLNTVNIPHGCSIRAEDEIYLNANLQVPVVIYGNTTDLTVRKTIFFEKVSRNIAYRGTFANSRTSNVSLIINNCYDCDITIREVHYSTTGVSFRGVDAGGDGNGFAYNRIWLGRILGARWYVELRVIGTLGWCNQNTFYQGRIASGDSTWIATQVGTGEPIAISLTGDNVTGTLSLNTNKFYDTNVEVHSTCIPVEVDYKFASFNKFYNQRYEGNSPTALRVTANGAGTASNNVVQMIYHIGGSLVDGRSDPKNYISEANNYALNTAYTLQWQENSGASTTSSSWFTIPLARRANQYDSAGRLFVPGVHFRARGISAKNFSTYTTGATIGPNYIDFPAGSQEGPAIMIDTTNCKEVIFKPNGISGSIPSGRIFVVCYDVNGNVLSGTSPYYATWGSGSTHTAGLFNVDSGYIDPAFTDLPRRIVFHDNVMMAELGFLTWNAGDAMRINSLGIKAIGIAAAPVFCWHRKNDGVTRWATSAPTTKGSYYKGEMIWNDARALVGDPAGWQSLADSPTFSFTTVS